MPPTNSIPHAGASQPCGSFKPDHLVGPFYCATCHWGRDVHLPSAFESAPPAPVSPRYDRTLVARGLGKIRALTAEAAQYINQEHDVDTIREPLLSIEMLARLLQQHVAPYSASEIEEGLLAEIGDGDDDEDDEVPS